MNGDLLRHLFDRLSERPPAGGDAAFSALPIPGAGRHMASLSVAGRPGLLLRTALGGLRPPSIYLSGLDAHFGVTCKVAEGDSIPQECQISILECTAGPDAMPIFSESAGTFLRLLGEAPTMAEAAVAVARFASIFSALSRPARQSVTGLIGELMLLLLASDAARAISCWRASPTDRFDFVGEGARVECKATSTGLRLHSFSWDQCNPPEGPAMVASLRVESAGGGVSLRSLLQRIELRLTTAPDAAARLRETVASTLGHSLPQALDTTFDEMLSRNSLQWFDLRNVPAIRGDLPQGVSGLRFLSDLSLCESVTAARLEGTGLDALIPAA